MNAPTPAETKTVYRRQFERVWTLLKRRSPIAFGLRFARITGHPKDAILLSQLVYWTRRGRDVVAHDGWIHKTRDAWRQETGLSRDEQESARRRLRERGLIQECRGGQPARLRYRLRQEALSTALTSLDPLRRPIQLSFEFMQSHPAVMRALIGPTTAFHRVLVDVTGSLNAALLLSRMLQLQRHGFDSGFLWFSLSGRDWKRDLGLNRRQLENARLRLRRLGLIDEFVVHARYRRVYSQVNPTRLLERLQAVMGTDVVNAFDSPPERGLGAVKAFDNTPQRPPHVVKAFDSVPKPSPNAVKAFDSPPKPSPNFVKPFDTPFAAGRKRPQSAAVFVRSYRRETDAANAPAYTTTNTTIRTTTPAGGGGQQKPGSPPIVVAQPSDLIWPGCVQAGERVPIARYLADVPTADRQLMLDEMAATHRQQPIRFPVAYIGALVRRYRAGEFIAAKAHRESENRRAAAARQAEHQEREHAFTASLPATPPDVARRHLAALRDSLRRSGCQTV